MDVDHDSVERNLMEIFGESDAAEYRQRQTTISTTSDTLGESRQAASRRQRTISARSDNLGNSDWSDSELSTSSSESSVALSDEEDEVEREIGEEWVDIPPAPTRFEMTGQPGILLPNPANMKPFEYFKVFFNIQFITSIVRATNNHASELLSRPGLKPQSRIKMWRDTCESEMYTFLGILFFMGTVKINKINKYWSKSHLYKFNLGQYMSRNRFLLILRCLYFDFDGNVGASIYSKVDSIITYFNNLMKNTVYPDKELTIDESMVQFRGRLAIRQYIKNKRHKFGVKLYILADPNGLVHRIHMYKGSADPDVSGTGHVNKVVLKLMDDYMNAGHSVYMDNFYNSVDLAELLLEKKTYCTGTLLSKRKKNPGTVTSKKLKKGESIFTCNRKGVCVMKWKDKRDVLTLSTEHTPRMVDIINRRGRAQTKPDIIVKYNKYMKGVDRHDQMLSYYINQHKSVRWYKKIGIHLFETMLLNSFFLYVKGTGDKMSLEDFRDNLLLGLLPPPSKTFSPQLPTHMPVQLERNEKGLVKRRKCHRCWSTQKKRKDSNMICADCNIGLCIPCYGPYHIEKMLMP